MFSQQHSRFTRETVLLAVVLATFPVTGYCVAAGRADFVIGEVVAVAADGSRRPFVKGSEINAGEAINTSSGARAQIRFTDGGYISLQPNSQFRVDQYQYEGKTDGKEKGFFSLLRGGMRAISGAIGHVNRDKYQVATPAATIGIRGTGYNAVLGEGLIVSVTNGMISLTNKGGTLLVSQGQSAFVASINAPPALTFDKPATPPAGPTRSVTAPPEPPGFIGAEQTDSSGNSRIIPQTQLLTGTATYDLAFAKYDDCADGCSASVLLQGQTATLDASGHLVSFNDSSGTTDIGTASIADDGNDGTIAWGRWVNGTTAGNFGGTYNSGHTLTDVGSLHYIVGIPTPSADMIALQTSGVTATYSLLGGTRPTGDGSLGGIGTLNSGSLTANFGAGTVDVNLGITLPAGAGSYAIAATNLSIAGSGFSGIGAATGGACGGGCNTEIAGLFAGVGASRAGVGYQFGDAWNVGGSVSGVAAFKRQ